MARPGPHLIAAAQALRGAGNHRVGDQIPGEKGGAKSAPLSLEPILEKPDELVFELVTEPTGVNQQRRAVQSDSGRVAFHRFDSGRSR